MLIELLDTPGELDSIQLSEQPQGAGSIVHTVEIWEVRHVRLLRAHHQAANASLQERLRHRFHIASTGVIIVGETRKQMLSPFYGPDGSRCTPRDASHQCMACADSDLDQACEFRCAFEPQNYGG